MFPVEDMHTSPFSNGANRQIYGGKLSIWNQDEEEESYYFFGQAPDDVTVEIKKKGELFYEGKMPKKKMKLTTLNPGENMVFELTVLKEKKEPGEVELFFENSHCDKK